MFLTQHTLNIQGEGYAAMRTDKYRILQKLPLFEDIVGYAGASIGDIVTLPNRGKVRQLLSREAIEMIPNTSGSICVRPRSPNVVYVKPQPEMHTFSKMDALEKSNPQLIGFNQERDALGGHLIERDPPKIALITWMRNFYSGGRIYFYHILWSLRRLGAIVYLCVDQKPVWEKDFPGFEPIYVNSIKKLPKDIDIVIGGSTNSTMVEQAQAFAKKVNARYISFSFEVSDFIAQTDPELSKAHRDQDDFGKTLQPNLMVTLEDKVGASFAKKAFPNINKWAALHPAVNSMAVDRALLSTNPHPEYPYLVASARKTKSKNLGLCERLVRECAEKYHRNLDLVVFSSHSGKEVISGKNKIIYMTGADEVSKLVYMRHAAAVLYPTTFEGYGMVPSEALSLGTPVVAYDIPVLVSNYGKDINFVPIRDEKAFISKTMEIVNKTIEVPRETQKRVREKYSLYNMPARIENLPYLAINKKRVSAHMIAYSASGLPRYAIESVYPYVDEILIAYGPVGDAIKAGWKEDGTLEDLRSLPDPDNKIKIYEKSLWGDKRQMRQYLVDRMDGNFQLILDGDEIWTGIKHVIDSPNNTSRIRIVGFWHDDKHWAYGQPGDTRWGEKLPKYPIGSIFTHYRASNWRYSYRFKSHPTPVPPENVQNPSITLLKRAKPCYDTCVWHLGHCLPKEIMLAKFEFYNRRDGRDQKRLDRMKAWLDWNGQLGDYYDCIVEEVKVPLPGVVRRAFDGMNSWKTKANE